MLTSTLCASMLLASSMALGGGGGGGGGGGREGRERGEERGAKWYYQVIVITICVANTMKHCRANPSRRIGERTKRGNS